MTAKELFNTKSHITPRKPVQYNRYEKAIDKEGLVDFLTRYAKETTAAEHHKNLKIAADRKKAGLN